jgi:hypothetical protein
MAVDRQSAALAVVVWMHRVPPQLAVRDVFYEVEPDSSNQATLQGLHLSFAFLCMIIKLII